eukprot:TRINITY_DN11050_c0_g1_i1.p1 TRINITY_DN11050_c0_g1~~TRINITY_DN11050_c0_g1_i1.p1  ORF type:complete len:222 (-),score=78.52 TRINITY_DN11050_c0_g1_i1:23-688(-)
MIHNYGSPSTSSTSTNFSGVFAPENYQKGDGLIIEGKVEQIRNHSVLQSGGKSSRYLALVIENKVSKKRVFKDGVEIDTSKEEKIEKKGYLNKYDRHVIADPNELTNDQLVSTLGGSALPKGFYDDQLKNLHPKTHGRFEFWLDHSSATNLELKPGNEIKLKTKGNSVFVETITKTSDKPSAANTNYRGENVLDAWTNKIGGAKSESAEKKKEDEDDDDWK